jgi:hypothetical protein
MVCNYESFAESVDGMAMLMDAFRAIKPCACFMEEFVQSAVKKKTGLSWAILA